MGMRSIKIIIQKKNKETGRFETVFGDYSNGQWMDYNVYVINQIFEQVNAMREHENVEYSHSSTEDDHTMKFHFGDYIIDVTCGE